MLIAIPLSTSTRVKACEANREPRSVLKIPGVPRRGRRRTACTRDKGPSANTFAPGPSDLEG